VTERDHLTRDRGAAADGHSQPVEPRLEGDRRLVGHYEIQHEVGRGGMGVVYRAWDVVLGRSVALKTPRVEHTIGATQRSKFLREARAISSLSHPGIVTVYEAFEADGVPWLAMELVDGESLSSLLADGAPIALDLVVEHAVTLAGALRLAHENGVLHRDLKPSNVMVGNDGRARLTDFGLARAVLESSSGAAVAEQSTITGDGRMVGTPGYMSPEQVLGRPLDGRSDLFALGLVLYEMCTGRRAFPRDSGGRWIDQLLHDQPEPVEALNLDVPPDLAAIICKLLRKRPVERYQSAADLETDLQALQRRLDSGSASDPRVPRPMEGPKAVRLAVVAAVMIAGVVAVTLMSSRSGTTSFVAVEPLTHTMGAGWEGDPAVSPDGREVVYSSDAAGHLDLWLMDARGGEPLRLTDDPADDHSPSWTPAGDRIVFVSERTGVPSIWQMDRFGSEPVLLMSDADDPAVSPDGTRLAFSRAGNGDDWERIWVAPLGNLGQARPVSPTGVGVWGHAEPAWSPDGRRLAYCDFQDLWVVDADGAGPARRVTDSRATSRDPSWFPDGKSLLYTSWRDGTVALWTLHVGSGTSIRVTPGTGPERQPSLSRDGTVVAYSTNSAEPDVVVVDRVTGHRERLASTAIEALPDISRDGTKVVLSSDRSGSRELWIQPMSEGRSAGPARRITNQERIPAIPRFSPDGRWVAYYLIVRDRREVWMVSVDGGTPRRVTDGPTDVTPGFSSDGRWLVFASQLPDAGTIRLAAVADVLADDDLPETVDLVRTAADVVHPTWSPDGATVAFLSRGEAWTVPIAPGPDGVPRAVGGPVRVTDGAEAVELAWAADGSSLLVAGMWGGDAFELRRVAASGSGEPSAPLATCGGPGQDPSFGISGDERYLTHVVSDVRGDVWVAKVVRDGR
jgi:Tol biopolymer transport system component/predicted Ser/Thr protein kinase